MLKYVITTRDNSSISHKHIKELACAKIQWRAENNSIYAV